MASSTVFKPAVVIDGAIGTSFGFASTAVALPGTAPGSDAYVRVANLGPCHISVKLGTTSAVTVSQSTGLVVMAGQVEYINLPAGTLYIAGVAAGGPGNSSTVNLTTSTS